eukprot:2411175-Amphidinium_carterae.1
MSAQHPELGTATSRVHMLSTSQAPQLCRMGAMQASAGPSTSCQYALASLEGFQDVNGYILHDVRPPPCQHRETNRVTVRGLAMLGRIYYAHKRAKVANWTSCEKYTNRRKKASLLAACANCQSYSAVHSWFLQSLDLRAQSISKLPPIIWKCSRNRSDGTSVASRLASL